RTIFAVLVAVSILEGQSAVAIGIVAAPALSLCAAPAAFARKARMQPCIPGRGAEEMPVSAEDRRNLSSPESDDGQGQFSMARGTGFSASVLVIMFSEQVMLNAGPLIVRAFEGAAAAGFIFNVLMIARAPLQ